MKRKLCGFLLVCMIGTLSACSTTQIEDQNKLTETVSSEETTGTDDASYSEEDAEYPKENAVHVVNLRGDETTIYRSEDGRYTDHKGDIYVFDSIDTWTGEGGAEWNEVVE